jgi:hypothetical protein
MLCATNDDMECGMCNVEQCIDEVRMNVQCGTMYRQSKDWYAIFPKIVWKLEWINGNGKK